jgi:hypothetical protein
VEEEVPGAKARRWLGFIAWAEAQAYLRGKDKDRSRFPEGMTERKANDKGNGNDKGNSNS